MSSYICDEIRAIRFTPDDTGLARDHYLVVELGGDSNVTCKGKRARSWSALAVGEEWEVIHRVCRQAADCAGGMLKLRGKETKPENYIKAVRFAMADCMTLAEAREAGLCINARIRYTAAESKCYTFRALAKLRTPTATKLYGTDLFLFPFCLDNKADLAMWLENCRRVGWYNAEVSGIRFVGDQP